MSPRQHRDPLELPSRRLGRGVGDLVEADQVDRDVCETWAVVAAAAGVSVADQADFFRIDELLVVRQEDGFAALVVDVELFRELAVAVAALEAVDRPSDSRGHQLESIEEAGEGFSWAGASEHEDEAVGCLQHFSCIVDYHVILRNIYHADNND